MLVTAKLTLMTTALNTYYTIIDFYKNNKMLKVEKVFIIC